MNNDERLELLREEFVALLAEEKKIKDPIKRRFAKMAEAEILEATEAINREYAIKFEVARRTKGITREDLERAVFGSKGSPRYKKFVELAGGQLTAYTTAEGRVAERVKQVEAGKDALLESLGVEYQGIIAPYGVEHDLRSHGFEILETGTTFYLAYGGSMPIGERQGDTVAWAKAHAAEIKQLNEFYVTEGEN